jgi:hypothetical protein
MILSRTSGFDLLNLSNAGVDRGPCVLVSYEDSDRRIQRRFQILVQHYHAVIARTHNERAASQFLVDLQRNLWRVTLTGKSGSGIVCRDFAGKIVPNGGLIDELITAVRKFAVSDVLIGIDPLRLAICGSQNDDDGADVVVHALNDIATRLPNSGLVVTSHTNKAQAPDPGRGQAASAYATSGSALYSQHARSNFRLARLAPEVARKLFAPSDVEDEEAKQQRVVELIHARLSHGVETGTRYFVMRGGVLVPVAASGDEAHSYNRRMAQWRDWFQKDGKPRSARRLEQDRDKIWSGITVRDLRSFLEDAREQGDAIVALGEVKAGQEGELLRPRVLDGPVG